MRRLIILLIVAAFVVAPVAALAQEEPYSSSTTEVTSPPEDVAGPGTPEFPYTGFALVPFAVAIGALALFGTTALWFSRRPRVKADD